MKKFDMDDGMTMVFRAARPGDAQSGQSRRQGQIRRRKVNGQFTLTKIRKGEMMLASHPLQIIREKT